MSWSHEVRLVLQDCRRRKVPFGTAWLRAVAATHREEPQDLAWHRRVFSRAYRGQNPFERGDVDKAAGLAGEIDDDRREFTPRAPREVDPTRCMFGERCEERRVEGSYMCGPHKRRLEAAMAADDPKDVFLEAA